jgi:hypothetical protein
MTNLERVVQVGVLVCHKAHSQLFLFVGQVLTYWGVTLHSVPKHGNYGATSGIRISQGSFQQNCDQYCYA